MTMKFFVPDHGETAEEGYEITPNICRLPHHDRETAQAVAEYGHSGNHSWWECSWPMIVVLVDSDGMESTWEIERSMVPEFYAVRLEK